MTDQGREKAGGRAVLFVLLGVVLLAGGAYAAAYFLAGDRVPRGTSVAGVAIGGLTPTEARSELATELAEREGADLVLEADDDTIRLSPDDLGLAVDHAASVEAAGGGRSWNPGRLWDYYTGGDDLDAVLAVDESAMSAALEEISGDLGTRPRNGKVEFQGARVVTTDPVTGELLDTDAARAAIEAAYLADDPVAELALTTAEPEIDEADVQAAVDDFANPAVSAPVALRFGGATIRLAPRDYGSALRLRPQDGELVPGVARKLLAELIDARTSTDGEPVDATVALVDGKPQVVPAKPGVTYEPRDVADQFVELVTRPAGERVERIEAVTAPADFTTKDARALNIVEEVSTFTTYYPHADYRNINIGRAAELIDGTVLKPGEEFSLNDTVGERTVENGFTEGFVINDGILVRDLGGGVSQMATTAFNAAFYAGLKDVEHKPHSFYIDRYPEGLEATVAWGAIDLRFENDTDHGVLISAKVTPSTFSSQGVVTVTMYSTETWDIESRTSDRYNFTSPDTRRLNTPNCEPNTGYGGFDVDVWRYFREPGSDEVVREEKFHTTYIPSDTVICTGGGNNT